MKKYLLMLAVAAMMVSCGNNGNGGSTDTSSTSAQEEVAEQPSNNIDTEKYSCVAPEGFEVSKSAFGFRMEQKDGDRKVIKISDSDKTVQDKIDYYTKTNSKQVDDITAGGLTWKVVTDEKAGLSELFAENPNGGCVEVETAYMELNDDILKNFLETVKLK